MRIGAFSKLLLRALSWVAGSIAALILIWFAANRLLDERPDSRRDAFLASTERAVPDAENLAVGIAGLDAPPGSDFIKHGAALKKLYDTQAPWSTDIQMATQRPDALKITVESHQLDCWMDPDQPFWKDCLSFDGASQALAENREILARYKALYKLDGYSGFGEQNQQLIPLTKLAVVEMRRDVRNGSYDTAYRNWRENFYFSKNQLRRQTDWVGKAIGLVDLSMSFSFIEDLLVKQPSLARAHFDELQGLLRPEGMEMVNPAGIARAEYLTLERFLRTPYVMNPAYKDTFEWLAWKFAQPNHVGNRYLAFLLDYTKAMQRPWQDLPQEFARIEAQHYSFGWGDSIDPFGWILLVKVTHWQLKPTEMLRQIHITDGKLRLATLVVRIVRDRVKDADIPAFLAKSSDLYDPFSNKPMQWDAKNGRIYFLNGDDKCSITPLRVPVWDAKGGRRSPKHADWAIC